MVKFGHLHRGTFTGSALQPLASLVAANENVCLVPPLLALDNSSSIPFHFQNEISVLVRRGEEGFKPLKFTPRQGWGGRGMLGYVAYDSSLPLVY